jgi:glycosyltransferase involved in cell wall biosynthesis
MLPRRRSPIRQARIIRKTGDSKGPRKTASTTRRSIQRASIAKVSRSRTLLKPIINSERPKVSVIIPAMNEGKNIARVIAYSRKVHPDTEVIVVVNGSSDHTEQHARRMGAKVIVYASPLGHDVGRSIGASQAKGDIVLFTDADIVIPTKLLLPFVKGIENGLDVALNRYTGITNTKHVHNVVLAKHALNVMLHRSDLTGMSMTTIPHAISRNALRTIGHESLTVPPKALAIAVWTGLKVQGTAYVDVGRPNPRKRKWTKVDPLKKLIVGDHLEAISWVIDNTNGRGGHTDSIRKRDMVK